ncbi:MAG: tetratricopeptide repeat protein [Polyangiaceae bacterium]|nr:tetratricopeptide repeat protein [Polyangiaceae bacterium]
MPDLSEEEREQRWDDAARALEEARACNAAGRMEDAARLADAARAELLAVLGEDHPDFAQAVCTVGIVCAARGELAEGRTHLERALALFSKWREEPVVRAMERDARLHLADVVTKLGAFAEAEQLLRALIDDIANDPTAAPTDAWEALNHLGVCLRFAGRFDEAQAAYERSAALFGDSQQGAHPMILHNLAGLASARGDYEGALRFASAAVAERRAEGRREFGLATDLCGLGDALAGLERFADADAAYREAIEVFLASERPQHPEVAFALHNHADVLAALGRVDDAERTYQESIARKRRALGDAQFEVGATLNNLAAMLFEHGRVPEARALAREAVHIVQATLERGHPVREGCEALARAIGAAP